jgi:hypothetical protein
MFTLCATEIPLCATFLLRDLDMQDVCWLCDLLEAPLIRPCVANCVAGEVDKAYKRCLVIELVRPNARHAGSSTDHVPTVGAGGLPID